MPTHLKNYLLASLGALALGATSGCISTSETVYSDEVRTNVSFATEKAGRIFYETLARMPEHHQRTEKHTEVNLILVEVDHRVVAGPNKRFNEAVAICDSDHNGTITESEAEIFANSQR